MDLHSFVKKCFNKYETELLPSNEWWEDAHHPLPACLGGEVTIRLWRSDHVIHGLLQSEHYDHPCLFGDGEEFVQGEYKALLKKWRKRLSQHAREKLPVEALRKGYLGMKKSMTEEDELKRREKAKETILRNNPNHFSEMAKKARENESPEKKSARGSSISEEARAKGRAKTNSRKFRCLQTGRIMPLGPLAAFQKKHNIDPSLREEVTPPKDELN